MKSIAIDGPAGAGKSTIARKVAEKLSEDFLYARIDLYDIKNKIYFGEITLSPNSGFDTDITYNTDKILGEKLQIKEYTK